MSAIDTATSVMTARGKPSPWPSRIAVAAVFFFLLVLFLENIRDAVWVSIFGTILVHVYAVVLLRWWERMERSIAGDTAIAVLLIEYILIAGMFWDRFGANPWSTFGGLLAVQMTAFAVVSYWKEVRKAPGTAKFGMVIILLYTLAVFLAPIIAPFGESDVVSSKNFANWGYELEEGRGEALMGTDKLGRDVFTRVIYGARNTVALAIAATAMAFLIGGVCGLLAATLSGWVDQVLSRAVDVLMAIPTLIFALLILSVLGTDVIILIMVIAILDATRVYRLARAVAINIVVMDYVEAAKLRGEGLWYIIQKEVLPNAAAPLVAEFGLRFCFVFLFISALSFLGLGLQPPTADWGSMVRETANLINFFPMAEARLLAMTPLVPAGAIALLTVAVNFVVDWFLHKTSGLKE